ncbi:helix-turn-helix domain-containing protein [Coprobacillus cateniformis]|nr:helix-turn-helix transcriptional regulator [Coprobacillus cateniformis]
MAFADNLKQMRKKKGISQEELAQLLNVSRQAVSKWEQGVSQTKGY